MKQTNIMTKDEMINYAINKINDRKAFENLSINGRYNEKNRERFEKASKKASLEADLSMSLAFDWEVEN